MIYFLVALALVIAIIALALHFIPVTDTTLVAAKYEEPETEVEPESSVALDPRENILFTQKSHSNGFEISEAWRCNGCLQVRTIPPNFLTQVSLQIPLLDSDIEVHVYLCEECTNLGS